MGDACDPDDDNDTVLDGDDHCAATPTGTQVAADGCPDPDADNISTHAGDNCPLLANPGQENVDGDTAGDRVRSRRQPPAGHAGHPDRHCAKHRRLTGTHV